MSNRWTKITPYGDGKWCFNAETENGSETAWVKWDGCLEYCKHNLGCPEEEPDQIHICDLEDEIKLLQELKEAAEKYFEDWPQ